ncbi:MAG TPA: HAMP domain-containing sensor histidine kinase [Solirubrobacteraceae bacterium]|jgi:two-component system sensor histidine kinase MprB|nr:HAMP domain-containing sensor histidine kinase [Solirubrobacteraceae bacterium]
MSIRRRMVLLAAGAVAAAIVIASAVVYVATRNDLLGQTDASLREKLIPGQPQAVQLRATKVNPSGAARLKREGVSVTQTLSITEHAGAAAGFAAGRRAVPGPEGLAGLVLPNAKLGGATGYVQLIQSNGRVLRTEHAGSRLPVTAAARQVAAGRRPAFFSDATVAGTRVRVLTERAPEGGVWQVALPLTDVESTLSKLRLVLALVSLGGVALAAALGLLVSRAALVPVRRLTGAAERVARTQDLGHRIRAGEDGELGRLAASFNTMLAALERSRLAQRQLVSDASHELRTPLTSVQANLDALALGEALPAAERERAVAAARAQLRELTVLVGDLVDLSKTEIDEIEVEDVRLDLAAAGALQRARLHAPECSFELDAEPCLVRAAPARLDRAIANLLDNACKWSPPCADGGPVEVSVRDGRLEVRDHGPGIPAQDLPHVFDRFYRAPAARARPGSGLGLAIVRQMAESHGGCVRAANDPGGGARLTLELPLLEMTASESAASREHEPAAPHDALVAPSPLQQVPPLL